MMHGNGYKPDHKLSGSGSREVTADKQRLDYYCY